MKPLGSLLAIAMLFCALPLFAGCSIPLGTDSTQQQVQQSESVNAQAISEGAGRRPQSQP